MNPNQDAKVIDARGLSCPEPVVRTRQAMRQSAATDLTVVVSEQVSAENIQRMATTSGWKVAMDRQSDEIWLLLTRPSEGSAERTR